MIVAQVYMGFFPSFNKASFIPAVPPPRGGVTGRELLNDGVFAFFSEGFKIYNKTNDQLAREIPVFAFFLPGNYTSASHRQTSSLLHYRIHHNNLAQRIV